jgi:hypothetical protein
MLIGPAIPDDDPIGTPSAVGTIMDGVHARLPHQPRTPWLNTAYQRSSWTVNPADARAGDETRA